MSSRGRIGMLTILAAIAVTPAVRGQVSSEAAASILVFPKIIVNGARDTAVQISNTSNGQAHARCWYVNGGPLDPSQPEGPTNPPAWTVTDFKLHLTQLQPTVWVVGQGRPVDPTDAPCERVPPDYDCYGAGFDPGSLCARATTGAMVSARVTMSTIRMFIPLSARTAVHSGDSIRESPSGT